MHSTDNGAMTPDNAVMPLCYVCDHTLQLHRAVDVANHPYLGLIDVLRGRGPCVVHDRPRDRDALVPGLLEPAARHDRDTLAVGAAGRAAG